MRVATAESWYETRSVGEGVTLIWEPHVVPDFRCNIWHVRGRERDLLVDSGLGVVSLRAQVTLVTEKPLLAVASHSHFDHIGAHHEFAERAIHRAEAEILAAPGRKATLAEPYVTDAIYSARPPGDYASEGYEIAPAPATRLLEEGDVIDLGDRSFEVLHLPGHSPGGIGLWEADSGIFFAGDTVYDGELLDQLYHSDIEAYVASMERLLDLPARVVHCGHYGSFDGSRMRELVRAYLDVTLAGKAG